MNDRRQNLLKLQENKHHGLKIWLKNRLKIKLKKAYRLEQKFITDHYTKIITHINKIADNIVEQKYKLLSEKITEHLKKQLDEEPQLVVQLAISAIKNLSRPNFLEIHAHPKDIPILNSAMNKLLAACPSVSSIDLRPELKFVQRGDLIVRSDKNVVDGQILNQVTRALALLKSC